MSENVNIPQLCGCCRHFCPWATSTDNPSLHACTKGNLVKLDDEGCDHWEEKPGLADFLRKMFDEEEGKEDA